MHTLVLHSKFIQWLSTPLSPTLWGHSMLEGGWCQGTTCFLLWKHLRVFPTPTSDTFSILWTPTASQFQRHFEVLLILSPFQQFPTLPHAPSTPTPHPTPPLKAAPRPLRTLHPLIQTPLQHSLETLWVVVGIGWLPWHLILRVTLLKWYVISRVEDGRIGEECWEMALVMN